MLGLLVIFFDNVEWFHNSGILPPLAPPYKGGGIVMRNA